MWQYNDELYHFGVKGMKWGVRRYEDSSGHLTSAGKKRYSEDKGPAKKEVKSKVKEMKKSGTAAHNRPIAEAFAKNYLGLVGSTAIGVIALNKGAFKVATGAAYTQTFMAARTATLMYIHGKENRELARKELSKRK